jgi:hypothetical protein
MAKLGDDIEQFVDESEPFFFEKLGDTSALKKYGCLTVAQCALLNVAMITSGVPGDASEIAAHYVQLALLDIAHGELNPKHPKTHLPYSQYLKMTGAGMHGIDGGALPIPTGDWLITLDEAERWLKSKDIHLPLIDELRADLERIKAEGLDDWPDAAATAESPPVLEPQAAPASEPVTPAALPLEQTDDAGLSKREKQIRVIVAAAAAQGCDALSIPTGLKKILMKQCQKSNPVLFGAGPDPFNGAWKVAIACDPPRLRMADHKKFAGK